MTGLSTSAALALSLFAFDEKPLHVVVVHDGVPVPHARVFILEESGGAVPGAFAERIVRPEFDSWFRERARMLRADAHGRLHLDVVADDVWLRAESAGLRALESVGAHDPRHVVLALGPDSPLSVSTRTEGGFAAPHVSLTLQRWSSSPSCGTLGEAWKGRSDAGGRAEVPHFGFLFRERTGRSEYGDRGLSLRAETPDGRAGSVDLTPTRAARGRDFVVRLSREPEVYLEEPPRIEVRAELVDPAGRRLPNFVWVTTTHVADVPFGRFHRPAHRLRRPRDERFRFEVATSNALEAHLEFESRDKFGALLHTTRALDTLPPGEEVDLARVVLHPAPLLVEGIVDRGDAPAEAVIRLHLFSSELPVTELDRDAAWTCSSDPDDPERALWLRRTIVGRSGGTYRIHAPPGRWTIQAEVRGWWRSDPVRVDRERIDFATTDDCRLEAKD